jgi:arylsulfatase A-like enzyme
MAYDDTKDRDTSNNITRKEFAKRLGAGLVGAALLNQWPSVGDAENDRHPDDRPNFLWIITEDCSASYFGCYGNEEATTPHVDKLAAEGILYENAFTTTPVCSPARSTFMTGVYDASMGTQHMRSYNPVPDFIHFYPYYLEKAGYYCTNHSKLDYNTGDKKTWKSVWDESSRQATYRNRASGQPFHETITLMTTHEHVIFDWVPEKKLNHDPQKMRVPAYLPDTPEVRHDLAQYCDQVQKEDAQVGAILDQLEKDGVADDTIVFLFSDHGGVLPRSKRYLFDSGLQIPLIIRFPEKYQHLAPAKRGSTTDRLVNSIDLAPTIFSLSGIDILSYYQGQVFLGAQKKDPPRYVHGLRGRMDETYEKQRTVRDRQYRYIRNYMPNRIYGQHVWYLWKAPSMQSWQEAYQRGQLNDAQSAFWQTKPPEELYDSQKDPDNVHNLAGDPEYSHVLKRMRKANAAWVRRIHDSGFMPEAMMIMRAKEADTTIYEYVRSNAYPQERIISMAEMASMGKRKNLKRLIAGFTDDDAAVRYWAAYGCAILKKEAISAKQGLIDLLNDPAPNVAVAASEALYYLGERSKSLEQLKGALDNDSGNGKVRLHALDVIRTFGDGAMPLLPKLQYMLLHSQPVKGESYELRIVKYIVTQLTKDIER